MALRADRNELLTDVSFFMDEVAERGVVACYSTGGSGAAMDQSAALVTIKANPSGNTPAGMLMNDMVNKDLTQTHINYYKDEVQKGGKVRLLKSGFVVTNKAFLSPTIGQAAYLGASGYVTPEVMPAGTIVGRFASTKDQDGYAKVNVNIN